MSSEEEKKARALGIHQYYGDGNNRLYYAQAVYQDFCKTLITDPARAKTQLIARIQSALGQAHAQGIVRGQEDTANES